jgi:hypothetical protein
MDPYTNFMILMVMTAVAAVCGTYYRSRAAPKFVFATTDNPKYNSRSATIVGDSAVARYSSYNPATQHVTGQCLPSWVGRPPGTLAKPAASGVRFETRRFPPPPGMLLASRANGKKDRDRLLAQRALSMKAMIDEDAADCRPAAIKQPAHRARVRFYEELVRAFEAVGSRDRALLIKAGIRSRLPMTHRHLVDQAFQEAYQPSAGA